jgi:prolipoprotein diacylglyceryltransferase
MNADNTDMLIAKAIAALPYRAPSAGFRARVMAEIDVLPVVEVWRQVLSAAGFMVAAWSAGLAFVAARAVYAGFGDMAAMLIEPGGSRHAFNLLAAHGALILTKLAAAVSLVMELAGAAMPPYYEIAAASVVCAAAFAVLARGRAAAQRI